jgi:hypothetical protein
MKKQKTTNHKGFVFIIYNWFGRMAEEKSKIGINVKITIIDRVIVKTF